VNPLAAVSDDIKDEVGDPESTSHPAEIRARETALATRIQSRRAEAKHGDIFTLAIRTVFRRLLAPHARGIDVDTGNRLGVLGDLLLDDHGRHLEGHNDLNPFGIDRLIRPEAQLAADIERIILEAGAPSSRGVRLASGGSSR
jgi:hypothetical protein